jgi:hypothetical protein
MSENIQIAVMAAILRGMTKFGKEHPGALAPNAYQMALSTIKVTPVPRKATE